MGSHGKVYEAKYSYDGTYWVVQFDTPDISTFATTLAKAMANAREALAVALDYGSVDDLLAAELVKDQIEAPNVSVEEILALRLHRAELEREQRQIQAHTEKVARAMVDGGMSLRDAATAVGVSHQRVAQLVSAKG